MYFSSIQENLKWQDCWSPGKNSYLVLPYFKVFHVYVPKIKRFTMFTILHHKNNELMLLSVEKVLSQICRNKVMEKNDGIGKYFYCRADMNPITEFRRGMLLQNLWLLLMLLLTYRTVLACF